MSAIPRFSGRPLATRAELEAALALQDSNSLGVAGGIPHVDLSSFPGADDVPGLPRVLAKRFGVVPLYDARQGLVVAMANPLDGELVKRIRFIAQRRVIPVQASAESIRRAHAGEAPAAVQPPGTLRWESRSPVHAQFQEKREAAPEAPAQAQPHAEDGGHDTTAVTLLNTIISDAYEAGVSDIHFEPRANGKLQVRYRCDGQLHHARSVPAAHRASLISRIKILASLDISERRKAQDGKMEFRVPRGPAIELRIATIPLADGLEGVVVRLLTSAKALPAESLGLDPDVLKSLRELSERPHGLILVCGPTGSGKTTTLHSLLAHLNTRERKIWTAEDPIEITQEGLSQVQVNPKIGWTFATALRAFLRADPDVIMVGEMRDRETASIAVEASLTGHLVMSTLHTSGAPDAAVRLLDMGLDPFSLSDGLIGILAQRLVRRVCTDCAELRTPSDIELELFEREYREAGSVQSALGTLSDCAEWRVAIPRGCARCSNTGYKGRLGLYEWMPISAVLRTGLQRRVGADELRACAVAEGMRTLRQDGIHKALLGLTTIEQVRAVCGGTAAGSSKFGRRASDFGPRPAAR